MRKFETGATRDADDTKLDYEGFLSPYVLEAYATYMHKNRIQADGSLRASDNWQKGIPKDAYMKSMFRHFMAVWKGHRKGDLSVEVEELAALMFNVMGMMHELLRDEAKSFGEYLDNGGVVPASETWTVEKPNKDEWIVTYRPPYDTGYAKSWTSADEDKIYTHRYGALAHDQTAIEEENAKEEEPRHKSPLPNKYSYTEEDPAFPQGIGAASYLSRVDGSEVLGIREERAKGEVGTLAPEVRSSGGCEAPICGCKW